MPPDPASPEANPVTAPREPAATPRRRWLRLGVALVVLSALGVVAWLAGDELLYRNRKVLPIGKDWWGNFGGLAKESFGGVHMIGTPH